MALYIKVMLAILLCYMLFDQVLTQETERTTRSRRRTTKTTKPTGKTVKVKKVLNYMQVIRDNKRFGLVKDLCLSKIAGGQEVKIGDIPYQVAFRHRETGIKSTTFTTVCGGSIITQKYVITAAHCFMYAGYRATTVVAGSISAVVVVSGTTAQQQAAMGAIQKEEQWRQINHCHWHNQFSDQTSFHDLALIEVRKPFNFNDRIRPIPIANRTINETTRCVTSGYGIAEGGDQPLRLRMACVETMAHSDCIKKTPKKLHSRTHQICTSNEKQSDCQGDFGGALACKGSLVGIASFAGECGKSVTVYTFMRGYLNTTRRTTFRDCRAYKIHYNVLVVILFIPLFVTSIIF